MHIKVKRVVQQGRNCARAMIDNRLGHLVHRLGGMTFDAVKLQREIEQRAVTVTGQRFAPHVFTIKLDWTTRTGVSTMAVKELENEVLVTAIDYIEDHRFNIFAPVQIVTEDDIYADSIVITPSFGTDRRLRQDQATPGDLLSPTVAPRLTKVFVRLSLPGADHETVLRFEPCLRLTIGRAADNNLIINHDSVSKVHAIMAMSQNGDLLVSDSGSTQGTFVNGRCLMPGELEKISRRSDLIFGSIQTRLRFGGE